MLKKLLKWLAVFLTAFAAVVAALLFVPKNNGKPYRITVAKNQGISSVSRKLAQDGIVYNRYVLVAAAYVMGVHNQLNAGSYRLSAKVSAWDILKRIKKGRPDSVSVQILEGARFAQMRRIIDNTADIAHDTRGWSDEKLMAEVAPDALSSNPEGQFFPDSYEIDAGGSDLQIYKIAYRKMRENLQEAWDDRQSGLPYKNPYEMLIMASLIEKETAHEDDRAHVASVFVNRLNIGMRLQTDPTVIYGMGSAYKGKIRKADLQRDTPYNTYTRSGLTPTPIALPSKAALEAAAERCEKQYHEAAQQLSAGRRQAAERLGSETAAHMQELAMKGARFHIELLPASPSAFGLEQVQYQVAANKGGPLRPLNKVASGGELARISLALQVVTSQYTQTPTLIFDEVDTCIGGGVAETVGRALRSLGRKHQVLAVTHLPQVAACGEQHWQVRKNNEGEQTVSSIHVLSAEERVEEIARMLGGETLTATTRSHAAELLEMAAR